MNGITLGHSQVFVHSPILSVKLIVTESPEVGHIKISKWWLRIPLETKGLVFNLVLRLLSVMEGEFLSLEET